jgi:hypothetical protein
VSKKTKRQLRKESLGAATYPTINNAAPRPSDFNPDYTYVKHDLRRIGTLAGSFFAILIVLSFILPYIIR